MRIRQFLWRAPVRGENNVQTIIRSLGNLLQWLAMIFLAGFAILMLTLLIDNLRPSLAEQIETEVRFNPRPENPSWMYRDVSDDPDKISTVKDVLPEVIGSNFTYLREEIKSGKCELSVPINVLITNRSSKTIGSLTLTLSARRAGRTSEMLDYNMQRWSLDYIVEPDATLDLCFPAPVDVADDLIWTARIWSATEFNQ